MFACHTPPFRTRGRRGPGRGWRTCPGGHNSCHRSRNAVAYVCVHRGHAHPLDAIADSEVEDVGSEYCFRRATPGIAADQLHVDVQGPVLTVRALTEVPGQRFEWRVSIPEDVFTECITAEVEDGVLNVRLPKMQPRVIPVTTNGDHSAVAQDLWKLENWGSEYRLTHPAHGVLPADVIVKVEEGFLFVKVVGRNGGYSREVSLPPAVDVDAIMVDIENEMLMVTLPKYERNEIRVHCPSGDAGPSSSNVAISEDEDALYSEARYEAP